MNFRRLQWIVVSVVIFFASRTHAQDTTRSISLGPELLIGSAFPQSSTLKPITAYQVGIRSEIPIGHSDFGFRLEASYRHLEIQAASIQYSYEFEAGYLFVGPAVQYKWFELGVDIGTPITGNFNTFGGTLADTSQSLAASDIDPLLLISASAQVPIAERNGNWLSLLFSGNFAVSSHVMEKEISLHAKN